MAQVENFRKGRHVVHKLSVHLVFVPKYRRGAISERAFEILRASWVEVCADFGSELREANFEPDHAHLLIDYPPKVAIAKLVNSLKGVSARRLRAQNFREVTNVLWGDHFWSPSYCAVSCGGAPLEVVARYVQNQNRSGAPPRPEGRGSRAEEQ